MSDPRANLRNLLARALPILEEYTAMKAAYTSERYSKEIIDAARMYWKDGERGSFITRTRAIVKFGLRDAFGTGSAELGIPFDEISADETAQLDKIITDEQSHIRDLLDYVDKLARDKNASFDDMLPRLQLWGRRFDDTRNQAKLILGKDEKLEWVYGDTEHCDSCLKLNGIVKRASFWRKSGVMPQNPKNPKLKCGGWNCKCKLVPTDKPVKRGGLPSLP